MSSYLLTTAEQSLLLKGLKFCPTPEKFDYVQEKADMYNICRKIRLKEFFSGHTSTDESLVKATTKFDPPPGRNNAVDNAVNILKSAPPPQAKCKPRYNITFEERKGLRDLSNNNDVIIKEADNGSAVILMDTTYYAEKMKATLSNTKTYQKLQSNMYIKVLNTIDQLTNAFDSILTKKEKQLLSSFE